MVILHTDSYFALGKTHTVCQDYANNFTSKHGSMTLAVSDGCSSSPDTDFGARFMVQAAMTEPNMNPERIVDIVNKASNFLCLPATCLDATLLVARTLPEGRTPEHPYGLVVETTVWGDGVVFVRFKDGRSWLIDVEFERNTPAYLSYWLDPKLLEQVQTQLVRTASYHDNNSLALSRTVPVSKENYGLTQSFDFDEVESLFLFSDGVKSFCRMVNGAWQPIPLPEVLEQITAVKNCNGEFMVRRMRKFLYDFCPKNGWIHEDDVSVAAMIKGEVKS